MLQSQDVGLKQVLSEAKNLHDSIIYYQEEEHMVQKLDATHAEIQDLEEQQKSSEKKEGEDDKVQILSNKSLAYTWCDTRNEVVGGGIGQEGYWQSNNGAIEK